MGKLSGPGQSGRTQMIDDHYRVLGLKRGASLKEISAAYRAQALIYHPDKRKSTNDHDRTSDETFFKIKAAYQALQDPKIRAELDLQLIGQEERIKRDAQMSAQRKQMRDDLLCREKEALNAKKREPQVPEEPQESRKKSPDSVFKGLISNQDSCLLLKYKFSDNIDRKLALEMIKSALNPVSLHEDPKSNAVIAAEFSSPQDAYKALCKLPNDFIVKADWFKGYPPDGVKIELGPKQTPTVSNRTPTSEEKPKYSKELEESVVERLKRKKLEKQQK